MTEILNNYDILDVFDENQYQTVLMAIDKTHMQDIVIINKIKSKDIINDDILKDYRAISSNVVAVIEDNEQITIINKYEQSHLLSDYLTETLPTFGVRLDLAKQYLNFICHYENFIHPIKLILIDEDQLTVKKDNLIFSNYLFLKEYNEEATLKDVHQCIGKTLETILQLHRETLNSRLTQLQSVIYKLNKNSLDWSLKEVNQQYLEAITNIAAEDKAQEDTAIEKHVEARVMSEPILIEDEIAEESISLHQEDEIIKLSDLIVQEMEDDQIVETESKFFIDDEDEIEIDTIIHEVETDATNRETENDPLIDEVENDTSIDNIENDSIIDEIKPDIVIAEIENNTNIDNIDNDPIIDDTIIDKIDPSTVMNEIENDASIDNIKSDPIIDDTIIDEIKPDTLIDEIENDTNIDNIENDPVINDTIIDEIKPDTLIDEIENDTSIDNIENDPVIDDTIIDEIKPNTVMNEIENDTSVDNIENDPVINETAIDEIKNDAVTEDEKITHDKVILTNEASEDVVDELLSRNAKQHSDMYINQRKSTQKFIPTFLLFFIVLILITSLLIFYSSTYM